jgi:hypothetical protein
MKMLTLRSLIIGLVMVLTNAAFADSQPAPFGLSWGMSQKEVEALGVVLAEPKDSRYGVLRGARNLPKTLDDTSSVGLYFGFNDKLWRIVSVSKTFEHDDSGIQVKTRFAELSTLLSQRYGPRKDHFGSASESFYRDPERFAYAISQNKLAYFSEWSGDVQIQLEIRAKPFDGTYYVLFYEFQPLSGEVKKMQTAKEQKAL